MWSRIAKFILHYRFILLTLLTISTIIMGYIGKDAVLSYDFDQIMPKSHPDKKQFTDFKEQFGEDGNMLLVGMQTDKLFTLDFFKDWNSLGDDLKTVDGVTEILSATHAFNLKKDTTNKKFIVEQIVHEEITTQAQVDSLKKVVTSLPFYHKMLYDEETKIAVMGVTIRKGVLDSEYRSEVMNNILAKTNQFGEKHAIDLKYSGLPYARVLRTTKVADEIKLNLLMAIVVAALILLILFRSFKAMLFPMLVVIVGIVWTTGFIVLLGYKVTILTGLIPPLVVVISVPDCVYFINHYHNELRQHGKQQVALKRSIEKIGYVVFFANLTTAIGFSVFAIMESEMLHQFGIVAGLTIAVLMAAAIIIVPALLSFSETPSARHLSHLNAKGRNKVLDKLTKWVDEHPKYIQFGTTAIVIGALLGVLQLQARGNIFDDMPKDSKQYSDLIFFENHFNGVLPLEILIDTGKKKGITKSRVLRDLDKVQDIFAKDTLFSEPVSIVEGMKFISQAYYNGDSSFYKLPGSRSKNFILKYVANMKGDGTNNVLNAFADSTQQVARMSVRVKDIGSHKFPVVLDTVKARVGSVLDTSKYKVTYTGSSVVGYAGYNFLVNGLLYSVLLAFLLIALVVAYIFRSVKMLLIALLPNMIPLLITAGIMGFTDIYLKPATVLIFSVAFGISVDFTIHFLAKYRLELDNYHGDVLEAIKVAVRETGLSMIYTAFILFFGFIIFVTSSFEGTFYLGILTSITIIIALGANLVLLPSILLSLGKRKIRLATEKKATQEKNIPLQKAKDKVY